MVDAYLAELARCTTANQLARFHITIENAYAPAEIGALIDGLRRRRAAVPEGVVQWMAVTEAMLLRDRPRYEPYVRHAVAAGATIYAAPGTDDERAARTLVVAFSGDANRLMMPIALFLQHLPAASHEVLLLVDRTRRFYLGGAAGVGDDMPSMVRGIERVARPTRFRRAVSFGTSAGGLAALWTGIALGFPRAVSVGGAVVEAVDERVQTQHFDIGAFDALVRSAPTLPDIVLVSGESNERDTRKALMTAARLTARHVVVPGARKHNVLYEVWQRGDRLDALLAELID